MRTRWTLSILLALVLGAAIIIPAGSATAKGKKKSGPKVVGVDADNDWGANVDPEIAPLGDALGQELVSASIGMADKTTVNFIITLKSLPPAGGIPESSRYNWDFSVDGLPYQLTGAFTEYLRGVCNPLHTGACPPPTDPGPTPFFLRQGPCTVGSDCYVLEVISAAFDPATATITIPVPLDAVEGGPGSKIGPGSSTFGGAIYAAPAAIVSQASLPNDILMVLGEFKVPGKSKK